MPWQKSPSLPTVESSAEGDAAVRASWSLKDLVSSDGQQLLATFSCTMKALPQPAERRFFLETFSGSPSTISTDRILSHFGPSLQAAAERLARGESASALDAVASARWIEGLRAAAENVAFSCGIALLPPFSVELSSPSLQRERLEEMQRASVQRAAALRMEHFQKATDLLKQWESLRAAAPAVTPGQVLERLNPADRGTMLQTLLMASAQQSPQPDLWAVAGSQLVRISFKTTEPQVIPMPTSAGPLRSIHVSDGGLLIGAQKGVIVIDPDTLENSETYFDPGMVSEHGFTRAILTADLIRACHRDGGIVTWRRGVPESPLHAIRASELNGAAKHLTPIPDSPQFLFAVDNRLLSLTENTVTTVATLSAPIEGILATADRIIVVAEDGSVTLYEPRTLEKTSSLRSASRVSGVALMPWLNTARLLLATPDGPVHCIGLDDQLITYYGGSHLGMRAVTASIGKIATISPGRQGVILWNAWDGSQPAEEIHLTSLTRHRITDIAFG